VSNRSSRLAAVVALTLAGACAEDAEKVCGADAGDAGCSLGLEFEALTSNVCPPVDVTAVDGEDTPVDGSGAFGVLVTLRDDRQVLEPRVHVEIVDTPVPAGAVTSTTLQLRRVADGEFSAVARLVWPSPGSITVEARAGDLFAQEATTLRSSRWSVRVGASTITNGLVQVCAEVTCDGVPANGVPVTFESTPGLPTLPVTPRTEMGTARAVFALPTEAPPTAVRVRARSGSAGDECTVGTGPAPACPSDCTGD